MRHKCNYNMLRANTTTTKKKWRWTGIKIGFTLILGYQEYMANTNFGNERDEFKAKGHICGTF